MAAHHISISAEDYTWFECIGSGSFGKVYRAREKYSGVEVAVKVLDKRMMARQNLSDRVVKEIEIHSSLQHSRIVQLLSYFEDTGNIYLVLELCPGGCLMRRVTQLGRLDESQACRYLQQIVAGLIYLHSSGIIHRDLTLTNLLLTEDDNVKISDFGLATRTDVAGSQTANRTICGTPNYMPPEMSDSFHGNASQGPAVDLWSLGVLLYSMLTGAAPFDTGDPVSTMENARRLRYHLPSWLGLEAGHLIGQLLRLHPRERLGLNGVMRHPFLVKLNKMGIVEPTATDLRQICTERLSSCIFQLPNRLSFSIDSDGEVTLQTFHRRPGAGSRTLKVSRDGRRVQLLSNHNSVPGNGSFSNPSVKDYLWPNLPKRAGRMYVMAQRLVSAVARNTPRLELQTPAFRCVLYENSPEPDFSVQFYSLNGGCDLRVRRRGGKTAGFPPSVVMERSHGGNSDVDLAVANYVNELYKQICFMEASIWMQPGE